MFGCSVASVIGDYIPLIFEGQHYSGLCAFHDDRDGCLVVNPSTGKWTCLGCGAGGDTADFVAHYHRVSRAVALGWLAQRSAVKPDA